MVATGLSLLPGISVHRATQFWIFERKHNLHYKGLCWLLCWRHCEGAEAGRAVEGCLSNMGERLGPGQPVWQCAADTKLWDYHLDLLKDSDWGVR